MSDGARYLRVNRAQPRWEMMDLEAELPADHRARVVWGFVGERDLSELHRQIRAREGDPGRPPPDPRLRLALWLYAALVGVGSARQLAGLYERDLAYRWLCGGVPVNCHGLSDFRVGHAAMLDRLLAESLTALLASGVVTLEEVAIDGTRSAPTPPSVRFAAGTLAEMEAAARQRVSALRQELETDPAAGEARRRAAQLRAAQGTADRAAKSQSRAGKTARREG